MISLRREAQDTSFMHFIKSICLYTHIRINVYTYIYICKCTCMYLHMQTCTYTCTNTYTDTHAYICTGVCVYIYIYICICVCGCVCTACFQQYASPAGLRLFVASPEADLASRACVADLMAARRSCVRCRDYTLGCSPLYEQSLVGILVPPITIPL